MTRRGSRIRAAAKFRESKERLIFSDIMKILSRIKKVVDNHEGSVEHLPDMAYDLFMQYKELFKKRILKISVDSANKTYEELMGFSQKSVELIEIFTRIIWLWVLEHGADQVVGMAESIKESMAIWINKGLENGWGNAKIAESISEHLTHDGGMPRAMRIARTETHFATARGSDVAARYTKIPMDKEWTATEDGSTRETHRLADGQIVGMDEQFAVGGTFLDYPGQAGGEASEVINCRCVALYWPKGLKHAI